MTILRIEVCTVCENIDRPVRKYRIGDETRLVRMPLCDEHGAPVAELLEHAKPRRRAANKPMTMEQVAAKKTTARKKPPVVKRAR